MSKLITVVRRVAPPWRERFVGSHAPIPAELTGDCLATSAADELEELFPDLGEGRLPRYPEITRRRRTRP